MQPAPATGPQPSPLGRLGARRWDSAAACPLPGPAAAGGRATGSHGGRGPAAAAAAAGPRGSRIGDQAAECFRVNFTRADCISHGANPSAVTSKSGLRRRSGSDSPRIARAAVAHGDSIVGGRGAAARGLGARARAHPRDTQATVYRAGTRVSAILRRIARVRALLRR